MSGTCRHDAGRKPEAIFNRSSDRLTLHFMVPEPLSFRFRPLVAVSEDPFCLDIAGHAFTQAVASRMKLLGVG